ncbi:hypothetical protein EUGRSUZ_B01053 [Eucalyptus grandis]|uniref:Uncharacterized protein n=2 Tax=Eucalyptus grandis TaxID=71139 RepID=A0ACC3LR27_EUCGR|nr:hypothetical protein EUGRSUZ_B01053 [Eucalyptus grandis]
MALSSLATLCSSPPVSAVRDSPAVSNLNGLSPVADDAAAPSAFLRSGGGGGGGGDLKEIKQLHCCVAKKGPTHNNELIAKCAEVGTPESLDYALKVFEGWKEDECVAGSLFVCNSLIRACSFAGLGERAILVFVRMLEMGVMPDKYTFPFLLSACTKVSWFREGVQVHGAIVKMGFAGDMFVANTLIHFHFECGDVVDGRRLFDKMPERNVVSWTSLICGYSRRDCPKEAVSLFFDMPNGHMVSALVDMYMKCGAFVTAKRIFDCCVERNLVLYNTIMSHYVKRGMAREALAVLDEMLEQGPQPDRVTMLSAISASAALNELFFGKACHGLAKWIYHYTEENAIERDMLLDTAFVDMFGRCGDPKMAVQIFEKMEKRDVSSWTAIICAMATEGNGKQALELFKEMLTQGVEPDDVTFVGLLTACSHSGLVEQGRRLFQSMEEVYGISPKVVHYGCVVDLLGRAGLLEEALDFIKSMPIEPNDIIWGSLLSSCRTHKNVEIAAYAANRIPELTSDRTGIPVVLSNIYASEGKWSEVAKVRLKMKERGMHKVPGSSSTEVNGVVHQFSSGDESHPEMSRIALMLDEINCKLRDAGHVPDLRNVLLDVDDHEKKFLLSRHSEKLAIAYTLISTGQKMPVRVVKNLRTCSDCHTYAKLVSKVYDREISIRDNNRFHFFKEGFCSCGDFW